MYSCGQFTFVYFDIIDLTNVGQTLRSNTCAFTALFTGTQNLNNITYGNEEIL